MAHAETTTEQDESALDRAARRPTGQGERNRSDDGEGILRVDFADPDDKLEPIAWEEFFKTFEDRRLAFLYQDKTSDGKQAASSNSSTVKADPALPARRSTGRAGSRPRPVNLVAEPSVGELSAVLPVGLCIMEAPDDKLRKHF